MDWEHYRLMKKAGATLTYQQPRKSGFCEDAESVSALLKNARDATGQRLFRNADEREEFKKRSVANGHRPKKNAA